MADKNTYIVVIDDDELILELIKRRLSDTCHKLVCFNNEEIALAYLQDHTPHVLIVDQRMPRLDGIDLLRELDITDSLSADRVYLWSAVPLPEKTLVLVRQYGAIPLLKDVLQSKERLSEALDITA